MIRRLSLGNSLQVVMALVVLWPIAGFVSGEPVPLDRLRNVKQRYDAIMAEANKNRPDPGGKKRITQVEVLPINVKPCNPPAGFTVPDSAKNVTIADGIYYRDGRPTFLFAVEGRMYDGAWMNRILGIDLFCQHSGSRWWTSARQLIESPGPRGGTKLSVKLRDYPWAGVLVREALRGGTLWAVDYYHNKKVYDQYVFDPPFLTGWDHHYRGTSHFLQLHLENPEAFDYYASNWRFVAKLLAPYPVFHHELINEVQYSSYWADNLVRFQDRMADKYETIAAANKAWGAEYKSFEEVIPPITMSGGFYWTPEPKGRPQRLFADWNAFMAEHAGQMFAKLRAEAAKYTTDTSFIFQSPFIRGDRQVIPSIKAAAEDVYGQEAFFHPHPQGEPGKERWAVVLALMDQQFMNDLARNAAPDKPIINLEAPFSPNPRGAARRYGLKRNEDYKGPAGPNFMRMFFWHQLAHGVSGSVVSYFYVNESSWPAGSGNSVWDPKVMTRDAVREIPRVAAEIRDLATVVVPRPRIRGKLAVLYSYETAGERRPDSHKSMIEGYAAAVLTRTPVDVITERDILNEGVNKYPVCFLNYAVRFPKPALGNLRKYVEAGGTLVVGPGSLLYDERAERLDVEPLLGVERTKPLEIDSESPVAVDLGSMGVSRALTSPSRTLVESPLGWRLEPTTAKGIGTSAAGPPIAVRKLGKGRVYTIGPSLDGLTMRRILSWICREANVTPPVDVEFADGIDADYVETHLLGAAAQGRYVVYALNFGGGPRQVRLKPTDLTEGDKKFFVRRVRSGQYLAPDGSKARSAWSGSQLARGIPSWLAAQDPELFLLERQDLEPLALRGLSEEQEQVLQWAWRDSPPSEHRVLIDGYHVAEYRVSKPKMPTAVKALEDAGWEVNSSISRIGEKVTTFSLKGISQEDLSSYDVIILAGLAHGKNAWEQEEMLLLRGFVRDGGGLLICSKRDWHFENLIYREMDGYDVEDGGWNVYDRGNCILREPLYVGFSEPRAHRVTEGVARFQTTGIRTLKVRNPDATVLFAADEMAEQMNLFGRRRSASNAPVAVALSEGRGRVVIVGADTWLRPDELQMGDNKQFLLNIINWLGKREAKE